MVNHKQVMIGKCCLSFLNRKDAKKNRGSGKIIGILYNLTIEYK